MKKVVVISALISSLLLFFGCSKDGQKFNTGYSDSYVIDYYPIDGIKIVGYRDRNLFVIQVVGKSKESYGATSTDIASIAKYKAKCEKYGDTGYPQKFIYGFGSMPNTFQDRDFVSIDIVSDMDWDAEHPAGTSLGDIFHFCSTSPIKYIRRGYQDRYEWDRNNYTPCFKEYFDSILFYDYRGDPVEGMVSDLTAEDLILLGGGASYRETIGVITAVKKPTLPGTHTLTVTLTDEDGNELSASREAVYQ